MTVIENLCLQKENNQVITRQTAGMAILMTDWGLCVLIAQKALEHSFNSSNLQPIGFEDNYLRSLKTVMRARCYFIYSKMKIGKEFNTATLLLGLTWSKSCLSNIDS